MASADFHLTTEWLLPAPIEAVWEVLARPDDWPSWWRAVEAVEQLAPGGADGVGAVRRFTWRTALPYRIAFVMRTVQVEKPRLIEGRAEGELEGLGRWTLASAGDGTLVRYHWMVRATKPWMRRLAPLARPVFAWNHNRVMEWGRQDMLRALATRPAPDAAAPRQPSAAGPG